MDNNLLRKINEENDNIFYDILLNVSGDISLIQDQEKRRELEAKLACTYYYLDSERSMEIFNNLFSRCDINFSVWLYPALVQFLGLSGLMERYFQSLSPKTVDRFIEMNSDRLMETYLEMENYDKCKELLDRLTDYNFSIINYVFPQILTQGMRMGWSNDHLILKAQERLEKARSVEDKVKLLCALGCGAYTLDLAYENYFQKAIDTIENENDINKLACIPIIIDCMYRTGHTEVDKYVDDFFYALERKSPLELVDLPTYWCLEEMSIVLWDIAHDGYYRLIDYIESDTISPPDDGRGETLLRSDFLAGIQGSASVIYLVSGDYNGLESMITHVFQDIEYVRIRRKYAYYSALNKEISLSLEKLSEWHTEYMDKRTDVEYDRYLCETMRLTENTMLGLMDIKRNTHRL